MASKIVKNVVDRFRDKTAMAVVLRGVVNHDWGWFSREDPRMHLQTVDQKSRGGRGRAKVWLETQGQRTFEWAEGPISGPDRKKLQAKVVADRQSIEALWVEFMIRNRWLKAEVSGSIVTLTAYPGQHNAFVRRIDLTKELPGAYDPQTQPNWAEQTLLVSLDPTTSLLAVGPNPEMDHRDHFDLGPILWGNS